MQNREAVQRQSPGSRCASRDTIIKHSGTPTGFNNIPCRAAERCATPLGLILRGGFIPGVRCATPGFVVKRLRRGQADDREAVQQHSPGSRSAPRGQGCRLRTEPQRGFNINPKRNVRLFRHRIFYTSGETHPETILSDDVLPDS